MKGMLKQIIAAAVLTTCMSVAGAGQASAALGSADYQAMSNQQMERITGEGRYIGGVL